jgi:hypothetical protein
MAGTTKTRRTTTRNTGTSTHTRRPWATTDEQRLKSMAGQKKPVSQIAKRLRRSEGACRQKAMTMNLSLETRASKTGAARRRRAA